MASKRFPGKPLVEVEGKPLFMHAVEAGRKAGFETIVASPDMEIWDECYKRGVRCVQTLLDCPTGSHRVYEAANFLGLEGNIINLQGDVVRFPPAYVQAVGELLADCEFHVVTMASRNVVLNSNHVRVITHNGVALSFSREGGGLKHIGIYGYTAHALKCCFSKPREVDLEQDCFVRDFHAAVIELPYDQSYSVDVPRDIRA